MAVVFRAATDDARGTTTNAAPALPLGVVAGDLLIAIQTSDLNGSLAAMTAPAGWTQVGSGSRTDVGFMKVWTKVATAAEPATYDFADDVGAHGSAIIVAVFGQHATTPLAVTPVFANAATSTSHIAPSVAGVADGMLVCAGLAPAGGDATVDYAAPTGMATAQESALTVSPNIFTGAWVEPLIATGATGTRTATLSASKPYVTMSLVVAPAAVDQAVGPTGIASGQAFGAPTVAVAPLPDQTVTPAGIASGQAFGLPAATLAGAGLAGALYPSETLLPTNTVFPSDGGVPIAQTVTAVGIGTAEALGLPDATVALPPDQTITATGIPSAEVSGSPVITVDAGPLTVVPTPIDSTEAFGTASVTAAVADQTVFALGITPAEAFGRPTIDTVVPPPTVGPSFYDTYLIDGRDLSTYTTQIEVGEGLQDAPITVGANVSLPGLDGELAVFGLPGQQRRPDGPGRITFSLWLVGVDPDTGQPLFGADTATSYQSRWDELVRMFYRRRVVIDHPRPDGTRRAVAHLVPGESMTQTDRAAGPWFGRVKAAMSIPAGHWTDIDPVSANAVLANNGVLDLGVFSSATASCTELTVTFGAGNNPRLSTSYGFVGYNGTIAPGRELRINTATGVMDSGSGSAWAPLYENLTFSPGPRLFEIDPSESLQAILTHTGGGTMSVAVSGKRRYRTS